ncbi:MFS general substrate transporter [Cucurbitaria berberidis CBS 394.84]|uniref:MFS general substrate transporter n=1 Tax=Cucurbitaria berberidis CBS 394.84 TaxID=1168544 RepID=A0A9P4GPD1_9PLEO|nr:MFS general substrate transporter [Cucurbitaria berberidis CBS 394.84]KAF1848711.1 MFS general substrate transporter [Cucurbitaria berberidis CBS 394.84]
MSASFPFVVLAPSISGKELHGSNPMLLLAILTVASWRDHQRQMLLDKIYRSELADRTLLHPRRTLGLVQSVLVYLSWIAAGLQKPNLLKHTPHMTEWAQNLRRDLEYESDETISHLISLRQIDDQVQDTLFTGSAAGLPLTDARTLMHVRFMEAQLNAWKRESCNSGSKRCIVALRTQLMLDQRPTIDSTRLKGLLSALEAGKRFLDTLLSFPAYEYHIVSFSEWMRLPTVIMTVARLCMPTDIHVATGWDFKAAQDRVRLDLCLESLCYRMQGLSTYDKQKQSHPDFWIAMRFIMDLTRTWYIRKIKPNMQADTSSQPTPNETVGQTTSDISGPSSGAHSTPSIHRAGERYNTLAGINHMGDINMDIDMGMEDDAGPFAFMKDSDFDMEQFFDMGIWSDESYIGMDDTQYSNIVRIQTLLHKVALSLSMKSRIPCPIKPLNSTKPPQPQTETTPQDGDVVQQYPRGIRLVLITVGLILSIFIAALDTAILATAIPSITSQFGSISNIAWYGSGYSITNATFQSPWGKAYHYFSLKKTFLLAILVFEIGNVICALAPSSEILIFGRVIAGVGGGGIFTGAFIIIALTAGPEYRAAYMGILGVTFGCSSVVGPLMGGALTDGPGWRWCFWISLPIGFTAALTMFLCFKDPLTPKKATLREKIIHLDLNGATLLSGSFSCFVLAMHWIGVNSWTSARVLGSFVGFAALLACFVINEWLMGSKAMVRAHLFKNRLVLANLCYIFFLAGAFFPLMYTLPIQFQSVNNNTASQSGVRLIPLVLGISVFTMVSNGLLTFWRHYKPFLLVGALLAAAGNTKIYTLDANTSTSAWIGYELITAIGVGLALQIPLIANQNLVATDDLGAATSMSLFMENCGTALFIASCEAAFTNGLLSSLENNLPNVDARDVIDAGATQLRGLFSGKELEQVLSSYLDGLWGDCGRDIVVECGASNGTRG